MGAYFKKGDTMRHTYLGQPQAAPVMPGASVVASDFFIYQTFVTDLLAATSQNSSISIEADSHFEIQKLTQFTMDDLTAAQTANTRVIPTVNILITDTGSGRQLMDTTLPIPAMFGDGALPFILTNPKIVLSRSVLQFTFTNLNTTVNYSRISLNLIGRKIFETGGM